MLKPNVSAQLMSQMGMGRPGGMASRASQSVSPSTGSKFAAMQSTLLKGQKPDPKKTGAGKPGRQFFTKAAGGDAGGLKKVRGTITPAKGPVMAAQASKQSGKTRR